MLRTIKCVHESISDPIGELTTTRPIPTAEVQYIDPFLFLNHHGYQNYRPNNQGLPFTPHPHRGMDTVTVILHGDILHQDSDGGKSIINSGGVQWMHAGKGLLHSERSSEKFKKEGGPLEILQLWVNLPADLKKTSPWYKGLQKEQIPHVIDSNKKAIVNIISGNYNGINGAFKPDIPISLYTIDLKLDGYLELNIPKEENIFYYLIKGEIEVNGTKVSEKKLVEFRNNDNLICTKALTDSQLLIGHCLPFNEPVVAHGPFVMNTREEIQQAFEDFQNGKFGVWDQN